MPDHTVPYGTEPFPSPRRRGYTAQPGLSTPGTGPSRTASLKARQTEHGENMRLPCSHLSPFQGESLEGMVSVETLLRGELIDGFRVCRQL